MLTAPSQIATARKLSPLTVCGRAVAFCIAVAAVGWFAFFAKALLLKYPPIGPDEAFFSDPAINLLHHGTMSTDLLDGALPGIGRRTYWMPPVYFLYVASVFRFSGAGVVPLRLASIAAAVAVLILTYLVALRTGLGRWTSLLAMALVAVDAVFLRGAVNGPYGHVGPGLYSAGSVAGHETPTSMEFVLCGNRLLARRAYSSHRCVAVVSVLGWRLAWRDTRTARVLLPLWRA